LGNHYSHKKCNANISGFHRQIIEYSTITIGFNVEMEASHQGARRNFYLTQPNRAPVTFHTSIRRFKNVIILNDRFRFTYKK
jgi:hypothetical protein